jgi:hypothetical protein
VFLGGPLSVCCSGLLPGPVPAMAAGMAAGTMVTPRAPGEQRHSRCHAAGERVAEMPSAIFATMVAFITARPLDRRDHVASGDEGAAGRGLGRALAARPSHPRCRRSAVHPPSTADVVAGQAAGFLAVPARCRRADQRMAVGRTARKTLLHSADSDYLVA